jgi:hypothetical protein
MLNRHNPQRFRVGRGLEEGPGSVVTDRTPGRSYRIRRTETHNLEVKGPEQLRLAPPRSLSVAQ